MSSDGNSVHLPRRGARNSAMTRCTRLITLALTLFCVSVATAHEAWVEPYAYQFEKPTLLNAHLRVGQMFRGNTLLYNPERFERLEISYNGNTQPVKGRLGDLPAIRHRLVDTGLHTVIFVSSAQRITYDSWEKFQKFARNEGIPWLLDAHKQRGLPADDFAETYFRHAKSLITVGPESGNA